MKHAKQLLSLLLAALLLGLCPLALAQSGSWGQINQAIERPEGWQRFVENSPFLLGGSEPSGAVASVGDSVYAINTRDWGGYPSIDGSTVCVPMAMELARQLLNMEEDDLTGFVSFSTTHYAYERLISRAPNPTVTILSRNEMMDDTHPVDLLLATEPSDEELAMAEEAGVELVKVPFCYDAFVFLVNAKNPVDSLTVQQIRDIYIGKTRLWEDVGGEDGLTIVPFEREKNSGSQTAMENLVMQGVPLTGAVPNEIVTSMGGLIKRVGDYDNGLNSLGYSYLYYVDALYHSGETKVLSIDGIAPTPENLRSGAYPFSTCYYAVYRKGDLNAAAFATWLVSEAGQRCVQQAGYIPYFAPDAQ